MSVPEARAYTNRRAINNVEPYCSLCKKEIQRLASYKAEKGYILTSQLI